MAVGRESLIDYAVIYKAHLERLDIPSC